MPAVDVGVDAEAVDDLLLTRDVDGQGGRRVRSRRSDQRGQDHRERGRQPARNASASVREHGRERGGDTANVPPAARGRLPFCTFVQVLTGDRVRQQTLGGPDDTKGLELAAREA
jgi:hypothetical protein